MTEVTQEKNFTASQPLINIRWEKFCLAYALEDNGTKAAVTAGYVEKSAHVQATRLLKHDKVKVRIDYLREEAFEALKLHNIDIAKEWKAMAFTDAYDLFDWEEEWVESEKEGEPGRFKVKVKLKKMSDLPVSVRKSIKSIKDTPSGIEIILHDKNRALENIAKAKRFLIERKEHVGDRGGPIKNELDVPDFLQERLDTLYNDNGG